ncbi:helix-turn-helix domain-containing protein [uncultured Bacteroides sp.]|uniref:helix-turn-helix domain-containing protein n=1 Tax=uncultured Bacteroides sp. TaxID=162156 RepID=UPI002AABCDCB|nr:helix-turn-helix domain-containing protein [uncultured Bacteroides sp.]
MKRNEENIEERLISDITNNFTISGQVNDISQLFPFYTPKRSLINGLIFILVLNGEGQIKIDEKEYLVYKGNLVSILPFHLLKGIHFSDDFNCEFLSFSFDFLANYPFALKSYILEKLEKQSCFQLDEEEGKILMEYYTFMLMQYKRVDHPSRAEILKAQLFSFAAEVSYIYSREAILITGTRQQQIVDNFFRLLHTFHKKERSPVFYADKLCVSHRYLSNVMKNITGHSLYYWISEFSIKEAKILLKSSDKTITQISEELNFPNSSFFAQFFKKKTGFSPLKFRQENIGE